MPTVLVTGAGGGIGKAICLRFAEEGYNVIATDINESGLAATKAAVEEIKSAKCEAIIMDVCDEESIKNAIPKTAQIACLVNNAAASLGTGILEMEPDLWDANVTLVLKSVYLVTRAVIPQLIDRRKGCIVNIGSVSGMSGIGEEAYSAAKAGVISLTENLAVRYGPAGVRVNCVSPGTINSPAWDKRVQDNPETLNRLAKFYPLGRIGEAADVANAVYFLSSEQASFITGTNLRVDGGLLSGSAALQAALMGK